MNDRNEPILDFKSIKSLQNAFEEGMKRLEKSIAESITNKQKHILIIRVKNAKIVHYAENTIIKT